MIEEARAGMRFFDGGIKVVAVTILKGT